MRLLAVVLIGVFASLAQTPIVLAESPGTKAAATQHAIEEQANACAQRKPECWTATPTIAPTATATPTPPLATATVVALPTSTPEATPEPTPEPCWLTDDNGDIVFVESDEDPDFYVPVQCPETADEPIDEQTVDPTPTSTPVVLAATASRPVIQPALRAPASRPTIQPQPTYTPYPTYTPVPTATVMHTATVVATRTLTATPASTSTPTAGVTPLPGPTPPVESAQGFNWHFDPSWLIGGIAGIVALIGGFALVIRQLT